MVMYKKILLTHAGTDAGDEALKHAIHVATPSCSEILILHVVERNPYPSMFALHTSERESVIKELEEVSQIMKEHMTKEMQKRVEKCKEEEVNATTQVVIGYPPEEIIKTVKQNDIDLVVMAKRRKLPGFKGILKLGSISRKVLEEVSCPILIVDAEKAGR